jgi:hypothetical protein
MPVDRGYGNAFVSTRFLPECSPEACGVPVHIAAGSVAGSSWHEISRVEVQLLMLVCVAYS